MKKIIILIAAVVSFTVTVKAATTTNLLDLTAVNGTNNGKTVTATGVSLPVRTFIFRNSEITNAATGSYLTNGITNSITRYWQASFDASNWVNVYTNRPTGTNASIETVSPGALTRTIYYRVISVTTNSLTTGVDMQSN